MGYFAIIVLAVSSEEVLNSKFSGCSFDGLLKECEAREEGHIGQFSVKSHASDVYIIEV